jgi:hypothetical protein
MKSLRLSLILFCAFIGSAFAVQSIDQPFSELKLTDGRVLENARLKAFNSDSVFVRDDDGFVQVPYNLFPGELQPQLAKARAAAIAPSGVSPDRGDTPPPGPMISRPSVVTSQPFPYETLGLANGCFIESVCFYDRFQETYGTDPWVRVLQWGAKEEDQSVSGHAVAVFELQGQLWAWDINFGFMPLDVPPDSKENLGRAADRGEIPEYRVVFPDVSPGFPTATRGESSRGAIHQRHPGDSRRDAGRRASGPAPAG